MTTADEQYLQMIGARVLAEQAAEQQAAEQRSRAANQNLRNQQIAYERNQAAQNRMIAEAQQRAADAQKQREKERAALTVAQAELLEEQTKAEAFKQWVEVGNIPGDFEKQWPQQYLSIQQQRAQEQDAAYRAKWLQRYGGNPF